MCGPGRLPPPEAFAESPGDPDRERGWIDGDPQTQTAYDLRAGAEAAAEICTNREDRCAPTVVA
ncbi:hypothetical protein GP2_009_00250 [Gordonia paraffinivorans NBRC 108238]|uniref:Uncharacterized protein n=1 Tax=Gordonia paraffinivorans NBRC 108238 TaxID=1223543 RepID=A0ABQ0II53_9ACTN|nr:hypothetical protein GP2_009_00250 [Gordonia paraffinivorans NBRC 108238]